MPDLNTIISNDLALAGRRKTILQSATGALLCGLYAALCVTLGGGRTLMLVQAVILFAVMLNFATVLLLAVRAPRHSAESGDPGAARKCEMAIVLLLPFVATLLAISQSRYSQRT